MRSLPPRCVLPLCMKTLKRAIILSLDGKNGFFVRVWPSYCLYFRVFSDRIVFEMNEVMRLFVEDELRANWQLLSEGEAAFKIEPLK